MSSRSTRRAPSPPVEVPAGADLDWFVDDLQARGVRRVHVLGWRDLDDPDAGGSERHAHEFMRRWAQRGIDVTHRTSRAVGRPEVAERNGYRVIRRGSRYSVFPRTMVSELTHRMGESDALVEIWNGVPWMSPIWYRRPRITVMHHVHGPMWNQIFPAPLAAAGRVMESRLAPPFYRTGMTVAPSDATRDELLTLGFRPDRVVAVPNGVDEKFSPGGSPTPRPSVLAVARLAPVKRLDLVIRAAIEAKQRVPDLTVTIVGEGPSRGELEAAVERADAASWITLPGRYRDQQLVDIYRASWLVVSGSIAEGWGLSLTEAAACGTPCVATDIGGHRSSVVDGRTGLLVAPQHLGSTIADLLDDHRRRQQLGAAAVQRARTLMWESSALGVTRCLHGEVARTRPGRS
jgi:glycosyltransferase involved in cell wall biosynthesis